MPPYVTEKDLLARYKVFASNSLSNVASDTIFYAEREIEAALSRKYTIPFDDPHPTVKDLVIEACFVRYKRSIDPKNGEKLNKALYDRIDRILLGKEFIITGSGTLPQASNASDIPWSTTQDYNPVHSMLPAEDAFTSVDSERLHDIREVR